MLDLQKRSDLQRLVDEGLEESLTLDYKDSRALKRDGEGPGELCKDVSALANSAGGQLVYGIEEDKATRKPKGIDDGVSDPKVTREWIEQVLNSRVQPRMSGVTITRVELGNGKFAYVVNVPQTQSGPHQAPDGKYYKRFDLQSVSMHDYEIRDIMRRSTTPDLYTELWFDGRLKINTPRINDGDQHSDTVMLHCAVLNRSSTPAYHVVVDFYVDFDLHIPFQTGPFKTIGERDEAPGAKMRIFRRVINSPPDLPIFNNGEVEQHSGVVAVEIPFEILRSGVIYLETKIQAPGISTVEEWLIEARDFRIKLIPPKERRQPRLNAYDWTIG